MLRAVLSGTIVSTLTPASAPNSDGIIRNSPWVNGIRRAAVGGRIQARRQCRAQRRDGVGGRQGGTNRLAS